MAFFILTLLIQACVVYASNDLPTIRLPWGTWQASSLDPATNMYTFPNIRFGAAPVGSLRFQKSQYPDDIPDPDVIQNNTYGPTCFQVDTHPTCQVPTPTVASSEDCLFLDVYVPKSVFELGLSGKQTTPVVVWFYGGAFEFGAKSAYGPSLPFYTGQGLIESTAQHGKDVIFVTGNYRLGAFGWLAGPSIEKLATANAGLSDQRLLLQWVQDYIGLFGGDKTNVAAWGESAGASSILHHLLADGGSRDPLFRRALLQSPAFQWQWDRSPGGTLDQVYDNFTELAKCAGSSNSFECLLDSSATNLAQANQGLFDQSRKVGLFPVGPALDGELIKELPAVAFQKGHFWKNLDSLVVSHTTNEAKIFTPPISTTEQFDDFVSQFIREDSLENVRAAIEAQYPPVSPVWNDNQTQRVGAVIRDAIFVCNTRQLFDAYSTLVPTYMLQYAFPIYDYAVHASDLVPTFWNPAFDVASFFLTYLCMTSKVLANLYSNIMKQFAPEFQIYLGGFAVSGDPNLFQPSAGNKFWDKAGLTPDGNNVTKVLGAQIGPFFDPNTTDEYNSRDVCSFWVEAQVNVSLTAGRGELRKIPSSATEMSYEGLRLQVA